MELKQFEKQLLKTKKTYDRIDDFTKKSCLKISELSKKIQIQQELRKSEFQKINKFNKDLKESTGLSYFEHKQNSTNGKIRIFDKLERQIRL